MNPYVLFALLGAILAAGAGGFKLGVDHEFASQAREDAHIAQAVDAATTVAAKAIGELRPKYTTIQNEVIRDVKTNTVYRDCKLSDDGMRLANQALNAGTTTPGSGKLPDSDPPQ